MVFLFTCSIVLFAVGICFVAMKIAIYKGKTDLIHSYHQQNVTDQKGYGRAFVKTMFVFAGAMLASGVVALLGEAFVLPSVCILFAGLVADFVYIGRVQKKYNGGSF